MKRGILIVGVVFAVALAIVLGNRMSTDATAVVVGVACGVLASIPTSLLLVWAMGRRGPEMSATNDRPVQFGMGSYPPVVVVNPGQQQNRPAWGSISSYPVGGDGQMPTRPRSFKVVGEAETSSVSSGPVWEDEHHDPNMPVHHYGSY